jgi:hypothetical protein
MANTQAMCSSFKQELMNAVHQFGAPTIVSRTSLTAPTADVFKIALYLASGSQGAATTAYSATNEVPNSGTYVAGGSVVTFLAPGLTGVTAFAGPTSASTVSWTSFTGTAFDCATIYNSTQSNRAVSVHTFSSQTITAGTFTITFPTNAAGTAMLNLA